MTYSTQSLPLISEFISALFTESAIQKVIESHDTTRDCALAKSRWHEKVDAPGSPLRGYPRRRGYLPPDSFRHLLDFESAFRKCASNLPLSETALTNWFVNSAFYADGAYIDEAEIKKLMTGNTTKNLDHFFIALNSPIEKREQEYLAMRKSAIDNRLGFYTAEQEADEQSYEWMAMMGLDPLASEDMWIRWQEHSDRSGMPNLDAFSGAECRDLQAARWKDPNGRPALVPVGLWSDPHHSYCFRAFNIHREVEAHQIKVSNVNIGTAPGGPLGDLIKYAADLQNHQQPPSSSMEGSVAGILPMGTRKPWNLSCSWPAN